MWGSRLPHCIITFRPRPPYCWPYSATSMANWRNYTGVSRRDFQGACRCGRRCGSSWRRTTTSYSERPHFSSLFLFEGMRPGSPVRSHLRAITKTSAAATRRIASHWPGIPREKVVSLFLSVVGMNIFSQKTEGYLEIVAGTAVPEAERFATLAALIDTGDPEEMLHKKQRGRGFCGHSCARLGWTNSCREAGHD